ncbi:MAG: PAS domain-containing sensor histidine kinase [Actinomycetota bacterium]
MTVALAAVSYAVTAGFVWLGLATFRDWVVRRDRLHAATATGLGLLGLVSVLGHVSELFPGARPYVSTLAVVAFLGSGYALLLLRDTLIPLPGRVNLWAPAVLCVVAVIVVLSATPIVSVPRLRGVNFAGSLLAVLAWVACVAEPAVRFWLAARRLPSMQRARLRALSTSYAAIAVVLMVSVASQYEGSSSQVRLATGLVALTLVPTLYLSLTPPTAIRRRWRAREERELQRSTSELLLFSADEATVAEGGLAWALRLVGADAGVVVDRGGRLLASRQGSEGEVDTLLGVLKHGPARRITRLLGDLHNAVVVPLPSASGEGAIAVLAGPFAPVFADEDLDVLSAFAVSLTAALDRVRLLDDLRRQTSLYESLLGAVSDVGEGFVIVEAGRVLYANEAFCRMSGYAEQELIALPSAMNLVSPPSREVLVDRMARRALGEPVVSHYDTILLRKDGRTVDLEVAIQSLRDGPGEPRQVVIARDVTERKNAEAELRQSEERWRILAENVPDLIVLCDSDGRIEFVNRVAGTAGGGVPLRNVIDLAADEHREELRSALRTVFDEGRAISFEVMGAGQDHPWFAGRMTPIRRDGTVVGATVIAREVTQTKQIEHALRESRAKFSEAYERERAAAEHLRALDEMKNSFLAAVSHELRTPLTSVLGFAVTLERGSDRLSADDRAEIIQRLRVNAEKLHRLLGDLLDLDRLHRGILEPTLRPTDLAGLVRLVVEEASAWTDGVISTDLVTVVADVDAAKIERIAENLLSNAIRHSPPGTPVWVRLCEQDGGALLAVDDAGPGVPSELRQAVFEPFQQGPEVASHSPGVGIGLSLVAQFARLHCGRVWVQERPGGGSSFRVWLPLRHSQRPFGDVPPGSQG